METKNIIRLEEGIALLKRQVDLLQRLADPRNDEWASFLLANNVTAEQEVKLCDLMDNISDLINRGVNPSYSDFEEALFKIFHVYPDEHFLAESVLFTLSMARRWLSVSDYFKKGGMNPKKN